MAGGKFSEVVDKKLTYEPDQLKTLFEALGIAPAYLSKRFIMKELCGWSDEMIISNMKFKNEEEQQTKITNKAGGYK
jgi:hypothetical protein